MSLRDIKFTEDSRGVVHYDEDSEVVKNFHNPTLAASTELKRIAGYFSSAVFSVCKDGIARFISKKDTKIKLITSVWLLPKDYESILKGSNESTEEILSKEILENINSLTEEIAKNHLTILEWLIRTKRLEIRIATMNTKERDQGIYHKKLGCLEDSEGNRVSFIGSENWSKNALRHNGEDIDVNRSWKPDEKKKVLSHFDRFDKAWKSKSQNAKIHSFPDAVAKELIKHRAKTEEDLEQAMEAVNKHHQQEHQTDETQEHQTDENYSWKKHSKWDNTWIHCREAVIAWEKNEFTGIVEMATGTGKTRAALEGIIRLQSTHGRFLTVIVTPYTHLCEQWYENILENKFGSIKSPIICNFTGNKNRKKLNKTLSNYKLGLIDNPIIITTYDSYSNKDFIKEIKSINTSDHPLLLICDEAHSAGAGDEEKGRQAGLLECYDYKLALSATPSRHFDDEGTQKIVDFFGGVLTSEKCVVCKEEEHDPEIHRSKNLTNLDFIPLLPYDIKNAIRDKILCEYRYMPIEVNLTKQEHNELKTLNKNIAAAMNANNKGNENTKDTKFTNQIKRWRLTSNASNKINELEKLLDEHTQISKCLIFCAPVKDSTDGTKTQWNLTIDLLKSRKKKYEEFEAGVDLEARREILAKLKHNKIDIVISMNCLNEGIDVPEIENAIIMGSSANPREYIQRRGRILRKSPDKKDKIATIYDFIVTPNLKELDADERKTEVHLLKNELSRYEEFMASAKNQTHCIKILNKIKRENDIFDQ